jgi:hypothetical protein
MDDGYPHVERDQAIVRAIYMEDEATLRQLACPAQIRVYQESLEANALLVVTCVWFTLPANYVIGHPLAILCSRRLAQRWFHNAFLLALRVLPISIAHATDIVDRMCGQYAYKILHWTDHYHWALYDCTVALIRHGAHFDPLLTRYGIPSPHREELHALLCKRNAARVPIRILMGIARFRRQCASLGRDVVLIIARMLRMSELGQ